MKMRLAGAELFHSNAQTDTVKLTVSFRKFYESAGETNISINPTPV
jgi:hypothetical protein